MTNDFFEKHSILGLQPQIIKSNKSYNIILIGSSPVLAELFYQIAILSNLPEQNVLNLYLVDKDAKNFYKRLKKLFSGIANIPHLNIKTIKLNSKSPQFYTNKIWKKRNLTNIIIGTKSRKRNLKIKNRLNNYISTKKTKILLTNNLTQPNNKSKLIAKLINYLYLRSTYNPNLLFNKKDKTKAKRIWNKISSSDQNSTKMQSIHISTKLLALGLKKQKSTKTSKELLEINKKIFDKKLDFREINDQKLQEYAEKFHNSQNNFKPIYFPKKFKSLFEKLIRSEHNRWNTYHYLNGWEYSKIKNKKIKRHDCLIPLEKFDTDKIKTTIIFDIFALVYIPNLLASAGMELSQISLKTPLCITKINFQKNG